MWFFIRKFYIILLFLTIFLSISAVSASECSNDTKDIKLNDLNDDFLNQSLITKVNNDSNQSSVQEYTSPSMSSSNAKLLVSKFSAKDISSKYGVKIKFSVSVFNNKSKALKNKLVTFKINSKNYTAYSNSKGAAIITLKLNAGKYAVNYYADGASGKNTINIKNAYKLIIYKWKSGADVTKNKKIKKNIPNSKLVKKIIKAAKKGTPVIKFKGGNGKKIFITSGVHGNEIPSQIASLKLIKYLVSHPINGTVYVMPFINPKAIASNVRNYNGINLNSKANVKNTLSYKTVKLITKFKCDAYGDFHCTKPGGVPGCNVAMGSYKPTAQSAVMAKFIASNSKVKYIIYDKAGEEYEGALEDVVNLKGIPAITCEVISPHGKISKGSCEKSLLMMKSLLKFNALI